MTGKSNGKKIRTPLWEKDRGYPDPELRHCRFPPRTERVTRPAALSPSAPHSKTYGRAR
jgi:hypothetical protein